MQRDNAPHSSPKSGVRVFAHSWRRTLALGLPAVLLGSTLVTHAFAQDPRGGWREPPSAAERASFMAKRLDRMLSRIDATAEQKSRITTVVQTHEAQLEAMHVKRVELRQAARDLMTAPTVDAQAVEQLRQRMVAEAEEGSKVFTSLLVEVGQILTQEQRQELAAHMGKHRGHGPGGFLGGPF